MRRFDSKPVTLADRREAMAWIEQEALKKPRRKKGQEETDSQKTESTYTRRKPQRILTANEQWRRYGKVKDLMFQGGLVVDEACDAEGVCVEDFRSWDRDPVALRQKACEETTKSMDQQTRLAFADAFNALAVSRSGKRTPAAIGEELQIPGDTLESLRESITPVNPRNFERKTHVERLRITYAIRLILERKDMTIPDAASLFSVELETYRNWDVIVHTLEEILTAAQSEAMRPSPETIIGRIEGKVRMSRRLIHSLI